MTSVYIDTNCFIHLRDLKDLPWRELFADASRIDLVVAPVVVDELDRLKVDRDGRRRDRSRAALALIEAASAEPDLTLQLKQTPIDLRLRISTGVPPDWQRWLSLDSSRSDDQLVAAALSDGSAGEVVLVSFDTGPLIRARVAGLNAIKSPTAWQLPDQPDAATEEVGRLQRALADAQATRAKIAARIHGTDSHGVLEWPIPQLPPLSSELRRKLRGELDHRFPPEPVKVNPTAGFYIPGLGGVSVEQATDYRAAHAKALDRAKSALDDLHERVRAAMRIVQFQYDIHNEGQVTASNLRVEIRVWHGGALVCDGDELAEVGGTAFVLSLPDPPKPDQFYFPRFNYPIAELNRERDPTQFVWLQRPELSAAGSFHCREFRPAREWTDTLWVSSAGAARSEGKVAVEISATNLAQPLQLAAEVHVFDSEEGSWVDPRVLSRLPEWMATTIRSDVAGA